MNDVETAQIPLSDPLTEAYRFLQRVVGIIALLLPPVVYIGDLWIDGQRVRGSISSYYYGRTGGWFVGSLCALGVFFLSYEYRPGGPRRNADNKLSNVASVAAIGVALLPTSSDGGKATNGSLNIARAHMVSAGVLFTCLVVFSLYHFTRFEVADTTSSENQNKWGWRRIYRDPPGVAVVPGSRKRLRNQIHRVCGLLIVVGILLVPINYAFNWDFVFFCESLAVWAFGVSWLVKSHWLGPLADAMKH